MTGLQWNYDVLRNYYASRKLSPIIQHLLQACPGSCVWGIGGHSVVLKVAPGIAAKVSLEPGDERLAREQAILARLRDAGPACPYIIQAFLQRDDTRALSLDHLFAMAKMSSELGTVRITTSSPTSQSFLTMTGKKRAPQAGGLASE
ncbi:unnamed protein product [Clonostachys rhizophaga]|uniref:Uncharacterized protein n=1 Tax=Clonostachys rhizophaga TaxID=160324 RepID=A0A9N9VT93_9HYPO|nr:unnamed protein product [Clonostachys rhizophaga]